MEEKEKKKQDSQPIMPDVASDVLSASSGVSSHKSTISQSNLGPLSSGGKLIGFPHVFSYMRN
jgi:hypothetical protein